MREEGSVIVTDQTGTVLWSQEASTKGADPETLCDALLAALEWTVQHHSGALEVTVPEYTIARGLESARHVTAPPRLATMLNAARELLTWFETAEVACCAAARA